MSRASQLLDLYELGFGTRGMELERAFITACDLVGLSNKPTHHTDAMWDLHALGGPWNPYFIGQPINIKNYKGKFLFQLSTLRSLPWDSGSMPEGYDVEKAEREIWQHLYMSRLPSTVFLKPANKEVEDKVVALAKTGDVREIRKIFSNEKNWLVVQLGKNFGIHLHIREEERRISSISIVKSTGRVFGSSEKPRSGTVQFRHQRTALSTIGYKHIPIMRRGSTLFG